MADPKGLLVVPVGFRADGSIHALELDTSDRLKVLVDSVTGVIVVTQSDPENLKVGNYGWDGSTWQKLQLDSSNRLKVLLDSVTGSISVTAVEPHELKPTPAVSFFSNVALPAGSSTQTVLSVTSGQRYRLKWFRMEYTGTVAGVTLRARINDGSVTGAFFFASGLTSSVPVFTPLDVLLASGWSIEIVVTGATLNDDLFSTIFYERVQ